MELAHKSYDEIVDMFVRTSSAEVLAFRPSIESQEHVRYLLERNKTSQLTEDEAAELNRFGEIEHLMQLVKASAQAYEKKQS
jgi:ribose 1,5-bisphosphokinase PhnN